MKKETKHLSLRLEEDLLRRFSYVARFDGRTMNGAMIYLIRKYIAQFEKNNGKIEFQEEE